MKKIKLKTKYILLIVFLLLIVWWGQSFIFSNIVFTKAENYIEENNEEMGIAYFRKYIKEFPKKNKALKAFEKVLNQIPHTNNFYIFTAHGRSGSGIRTLAELEKLELLNEDFNELKKYHKENEILDLQLRLAEINYQANNIEKAKELFREVADSKIEEYSDKANGILILLHLEINEINKAKNIFSNLDKEHEIYEKIKRWLALLEQDKDYLVSLSENDINHGVENFRYSRYHSWTEKYLSDRLYQKLYENEIGDKLSVKGSLKKGGKELANTFVLLQRKEYIGDKSYHSGTLDITADYITVTDARGNFELNNVEPGYYFIGVGIAYQRINNYLFNYPEDLIIREDEISERNINFKKAVEIITAPPQKEIDDYISFDLEWKEYPEAEYYKVFKGISAEGMSFYPRIGEKIYDTQTTVELTKEIFDSSGMSFDSEGISPGAVIGYDKTDCKIIYRVHAFDEKGNELSKNVDPFQRYSFDWNNNNELNRGDKLLIERKYEDAINAYEKLISQGNKKEDIYLALGKLYYYGYKYEGRETVGKNYDKAEKYLSKAYEISGDESLLFLLRSININKGDYSEAKNYNEIMKKNNQDNHSLLFTEAKINLYQGNMDLAEKQILKVKNEAAKDQNYLIDRVKPYLINIYLLQGKKEKALEIEKEYLQKNKDLESDISLKDVYREIESGSNTQTFYKAISLIIKEPRENIKDEYYKLYQKENSIIFKKYLELLGKEIISSGFPELR